VAMLSKIRFRKFQVGIVVSHNFEDVRNYVIINLIYDF